MPLQLWISLSGFNLQFLISALRFTLLELVWVTDAWENVGTFASGDENLKLFFVKSTVVVAAAVEIG